MCKGRLLRHVERFVCYSLWGFAFPGNFDQMFCVCKCGQAIGLITHYHGARRQVNCGRGLISDCNWGRKAWDCGVVTVVLACSSQFILFTTAAIAADCFSTRLLNAYTAAFLKAVCAATVVTTNFRLQPRQKPSLRLVLWSASSERCQLTDNPTQVAMSRVVKLSMG